MESADLSGLSTPALATRYAQAAPEIARIARDVRPLQRLDARARDLDRTAARWRRREAFLGHIARTRARRLDAQAQRLDARRLTAEMRAETALDLAFDVGDRRAPTFRGVVEAMRTLAAGTLWDVVASGDVAHVKSAAGQRMARRPARVGVGRLPSLRPDRDAPFFTNANGPWMWFYPGLVALGGPSRPAALVDLREVTLEADAIRFIEEGPLPPGAHVVEQTWRYVNRDETPDRRFSNNPKSDVALYGRLELRSARGLHEVFLTSDAPAALAFGEAFDAHRDALGTP